VISLLRRLGVELAVILGVTAICVAATQWVSFLAMLENSLSDYRIATLSAPQPQSPDIVIVTITEDTLQMFPYRSPLDRHFIATLLDRLDQAGARAIGVDLLFDQPTEEEKDAELKATIRHLRAPLIIGYIGSGEGLDEDQQDYLTDFIPLEHRGYVTLLKDGIDSTVRRIYPGRRDRAGEFIAGFPLAIAHQVAPERHFEAEMIAWRGSPSNGSPPFAKYPAQTISVIPAALLKNKIVLVGADLTLTDRHRTPLAAISSGYNLMAGIEIHAHAIDQLLSGRRPEAMSLTGKIVFAALVSLLGVALAQFGMRLSVTLGLGISVVALIWVGGFVLFRRESIMIPLVLPTAALGGAWWVSGVQQNWRERRQKQFLKDAFSRYMSAELVNQLVADPGKLVLGGERREMSFLFTDVAGFTSLSERIEAGLLGKLLNSYFNGLCRIIIDEGGTVIDFVGDAVFAIFGAPLAQSDHATRAIQCTLKIKAFSEEFRQSEEASLWQWGETRIGAHSGFALVGNFGADLKFKYAPVGDAVNTASRIEGLNKYFGTTACLSETVQSSAHYDQVRPLGRCVLKGRVQPLGIFEPMTEDWRESPAGQGYLRAYALMADGRDGEALGCFEQLQHLSPDDRCIAFHVDRLRAGETGDLVILKDK
jgi:CHASE2 domain-containing sensor protein/class 3 adenylate cyclase